MTTTARAHGDDRHSLFLEHLRDAGAVELPLILGDARAAVCFHLLLALRDQSAKQVVELFAGQSSTFASSIFCWAAACLGSLSKRSISASCRSRAAYVNLSRPI